METIMWICNYIASDKNQLLKINTSDQCGLPSILPNTSSRILSPHFFVDLELHFQLHNPEQCSMIDAKQTYTYRSQEDIQESNM